MTLQEALQGALENLEEGWEEVDLDVRDFLLVCLVRDGVKMEVSEQGKKRGDVCGVKENLLAAVGEHLTRIHDLRWSARAHNAVRAEEQTRLMLRVNDSIHEYIAICEKLGVDWTADLHELMQERPGPAPAETTSNVFDVHLCTNLKCVQAGVDIVHTNIDEIRHCFGDSLSGFLIENFDEDNQEKAHGYIEELIIVGSYIGPVGVHETTSCEWAFHLKGRALQNAHEKFGDDQIATADRYLYF